MQELTLESWLEGEQRNYGLAADLALLVAGVAKVSRDISRQVECGALASVLGGLTPRPVFGVPTSVGYGVARGGEAALSSMLSSCAPGIAIMNIDNGYGAACAAARVVNNL